MKKYKSRLKYQHHISLIHVINIRFSFCYQHVHLDGTAEIARILVQAGGSVSHVHINVRTARLMSVTQCFVVNKKMVIHPWSMIQARMQIVIIYEFHTKNGSNWPRSFQSIYYFKEALYDVIMADIPFETPFLVRNDPILL